MPDCSDETAQQMLELSLESSPRAVRRALLLAMRPLEDLGWPDEAQGRVQIVLAEALNNIVEHAYRGTADGQIRLHMTVTPKLAEMHLGDDGHPMPHGALPAPRKIDIGGARSALPEGGFGWALIHRLCAQVCYQRDHGANRLSLRVRRDPRRQAADDTR
ncbi:MAG: ATP-binding protein [Rhodobacteraceae bacterium]|jgi:serine/threonine-protein kinase RsbW|uniref:Serine/threonine-protein kinase RsbW n=1 Tax=Salipiger profundus TaxID=1229727 RepID=A0A1U7D729_9RHOB|nr:MULTISPECIES: ATP-binding protein [Salipiger]APX23977.1 serine/threonine-protein kinase RsbW [Salipiger profundus]MAB06776.1 ATP-binding protein [Paracoccaceae bacterium]GFZ93681.1 hypothetical protein GCM10011326_00610 [Salipiger profundus]SFB95034.1 serine/threonine-protein kinase RsbW [Salipiger profundus]